MNAMRRRGKTLDRALAVIEPMEQRRLLSVAITLVNVPIKSAAKAADPTLNNLRTVDVQLQVTGGDDWLASDLKLVLTTGSFYNPGAGGNSPNTALWGTFPHLEFDTWVAAPNFGSVSILGRKEGSGAAVFSSTEVNVAWGDLVNTGDGVWTIARLTMSANAIGNLTGAVFAQSSPGTEFPFNALISPPTSTIKGRVYNDTNANGKQDSGEVGLNRWQVFIDANNNGNLDSNEISVRTNTSGNYTFTNPGDNANHRIRVRVQDGFRRTAPSAGSYNVGIGIGTEATGKDFGVTQKARITGFVFSDNNGNAKRDSGEAGLSGWRVFIDKDGDGKFDTGETMVRSASDGSWAFDNLAPGTYKFGITQVAGFTKTTPTSKTLTVEVAAGGVVGNKLFGQRPV